MPLTLDTGEGPVHPPFLVDFEPSFFETSCQS